LRIFKNRSKKKLILIDNSCFSFCNNLNNGIPIIPFYNDKCDTELIKLEKFIMNNLYDVQDVRPIIKNIFRYK